jgi:hypothetical protein
VAAAAAAFGAHYARVVGKDGTVTFDHTCERHLAGASDHQTDAVKRRSLLQGLIARE